MDTVLEDFRQQLAGLLQQPQGLCPAGRKAAAALHDKLLTPAPLYPPQTDAAFNFLSCPQHNPLADDLQQVKEASGQLPPAVQQLIATAVKLADQLHWVYRQAPDDSVFEAGHGNAEIIGPRGLEVRDDLIVGLTAIRPGLNYPPHHHPPEEVYLILSDGFWWQEQQPWVAPGPGGYVYNSPDIRHAMRAADTPLLAVWCLNVTA